MMTPELKEKLKHCLQRAQEGREVAGTQEWMDLWKNPAIWRLLIAVAERTEAPDNR